MIIAPLMNAMQRAPWHIRGGRSATDAVAMAAANAPAPESMGSMAGRDAEQKPYAIVNGTAVVCVSGMLVNFELHPFVMEWLGLCSYASIIRAVDAAAADQAVKSIVLAFDSPGGMHWGLADAEEAIARAAAAKPTVAHTDSLCCSAAYWLACTCHAVYAIGQAVVGSIGTIVTMYDYSGAFEKMGIEPVAIASHEHKAAGTEGLPIRDEDVQDIRELVSECSGAFVKAVAAGRKMTIENAMKLATGRTWTAGPAAELKLTDGVLKLTELVEQLNSRQEASHGRA